MARLPSFSGTSLMMVAEHDPLRDSGLEYADRLRAAGVAVEVFVGPGHLHGTPALTATFDGAREWQDRHAQYLAEAYQTTTMPVDA